MFRCLSLLGHRSSIGSSLFRSSTSVTSFYRSYCEKTQIDDAFLDLLMEAGIDGADIKTIANSDGKESPEASSEYSMVEEKERELSKKELDRIAEEEKKQTLFRLSEERSKVILHHLVNRPERKISQDLAIKLRNTKDWISLYDEVKEQLQSPILPEKESPEDKEGALPSSFADYNRQLKEGLLTDEIRKYSTPKANRHNLTEKEAAEIVEQIEQKPEPLQEILMKELYGDSTEESTIEDDDPSAFHKNFTTKIRQEGDTYVTEEEVRPTMKQFCEPSLRKWVEDAHGALVGKGFYNSEGHWKRLNHIDKEMDSASYDRAALDLTVPAYTFRVAGLPEDSKRTVKRAYNPPPQRTKIPADLEGRYRFGITQELVDKLEISDKIKKVISFAYATHKEIRRARFEDAVKKFGAKANDSGNTAVQLCMLNDKVRHLEEHVAIHKKDQSAKRQLRIVISKRRRLYKYLKRRDLTTYYNVLKDQVMEDKVLMHANE